MTMVCSATSFKRFRIHKSDIKTMKDRCGTAWHFNLFAVIQLILIVA